jgi:hypothetical protein
VFIFSYEAGVKDSELNDSKHFRNLFALFFLLSPPIFEQNVKEKDQLRDP